MTELLLVVAGSVALAIASTYPLIRMFATGGRWDNNDQDFTVWRIAWVARTLFVDPLHLFDANIFYPHHGTLAYSESTVGLGVLAAPVYWLTRDAVVTHSALMLLAFALSACGAYMLTRRLTGNRGAAAVSGILFSCC